MAFTERLALLIDAKAGGAISELNKLNAEINQVNRTQTQATGMTGMFEKGLAKVGIQSNNTAALLNAGITAAATTAAYAMVRFGKDAVAATVAYADSVRTVQRATGLTAESASRLTSIFDDYEINVDSAARSFQKLAKNLVENDSLLSKYGINVVRAKDGSLDLEKTLGNIAEAYQNSGSQADRAALLTDAFGKSGKDLIPILEDGRSGIKALYDAVPDRQILSQSEIDNAQAYKLAMDNLKDVFLEVQMTVGNMLIPALTDVTNIMAELGRTVSSVDSLVPGFFSSFVKGGLMMTPILGQLILFADLKSKFNDETEQGLSLTREEQDLLAQTKKRNFESAEAVQEYLAQLRIKQADTQYMINKERELNDEIQKQIDLVYQRINADLGVEGAQLNVATSTENMTKVLNDANSTELERQKAVLDSKTAVDRLIASIAAQAKANGDANGNIQGQIDTLTFLKNTLAPDSPLLIFLDAYIDKLKNGVPKSVYTSVDVNYVARWTDPDMPPPGDWPGGADGNPSTPYPMAKGGIVTRPTNALIGEAGPEAVIPLGKGAGMGTTIQLVVDGRVLTQIVRDDLIKIGRANGSALGRYA